MHGVIVVDKEIPQDVKLTLHLEENADIFNKSASMEGKKALEFINEVEKNMNDNTLRVRKQSVKKTKTVLGTN